MLVLESSKYDALFSGLEGVSAKLCDCLDVGEMRSVVQEDCSDALPSFDDLVRDFSDFYGENEDSYREALRAAVTAVWQETCWVRPLPGSTDWAWATSRSTPPEQWQLCEAQSEFSALDETNAIYVAVLGELGDSTPEDRELIWADINEKVAERTAQWIPDYSQEIVALVADAHFARVIEANEESEADEALVDGEELLAEILLIADLVVHPARSS
ncbi:hypothetical protein ACIQWR_39675 [Streptomyces sp. NPDC098789]|uniref:hypothetical protein n=1 Tax=Streptomyces sp. NPDC098789 TaxID=3366098 RepID=UPI0037F3FEDD